MAPWLIQQAPSYFNMLYSQHIAQMIQETYKPKRRCSEYYVDLGHAKDFCAAGNKKATRRGKKNVWIKKLGELIFIFVYIKFPKQNISDFFNGNISKSIQIIWKLIRKLPHE